MYKKSISLLLIIFLFFSFFNVTYATEEDENDVEYQEDISENTDETEFEETDEDDPDENLVEENQEEQTENITADYSEQLDNLYDLLAEIKIYYCCYVFLFCVWFIIDFIRHAFFKEGRKP